MATTTPVRVPTFAFGLFELPYPLLPDLTTYRIAHTLHVVSAIFLASLVLTARMGAGQNAHPRPLRSMLNEI
jgi:cytochrome b561